MSISGRILQSLAANKIEEETLDQICKNNTTQQIYASFKTEVWPAINETIEAGEIESKVTAMQVLNKLLTRLFLGVPQNEVNDEFSFEVDLARQIATKLIAKVSDLYCCTHSVAILLECFVCGGPKSAILKQQLFTQKK